MRRALLFCVAVSACASTPEDVPPPAEAPAQRGEPPTTASLWNQAPASLFGNRRAREVGDILTVIVEIDEQAEILNDQQVTTANEQAFGLRGLFGAPEALAGQLPGGAGLDPGIDLGREVTRQGRGNLRRQDRMTLRLAARVTDRLPNGDLVIEGRQSVRVNSDERVLRAAGIVRPEDISRSNTVPHDKMAEAEIGYVGRGAVGNTSKRRWGDRVLDVVLPF